MTPTAAIDVIGNRRRVSITAIVDTGFDGDLCLPTPLAILLGLELVNQTRVELADGTQKVELTFSGMVRFLGKEKDVEIQVTNSDDALIGTGLLEHCFLSIDFAKNYVSLTRKRKRHRELKKRSSRSDQT